MKIEPVKQQKNPKYAAAMAALLTAAGTLTGCTEELALNGDVTAVSEPVTEEVMLAGEASIDDSTCAATEELSFDGDLVIEPDTTEPVSFAGDVEIIPDVTEEFMLDGDVVMIDE